ALCRNFGVTVDDEPTAPVPSIQQGYQEPNRPPFQSFETQTYPTSNREAYQPTGHSAYSNNPQMYGQASQHNHHSSDHFQCIRCHSTNVRTGEKGFGIGKAAIGGLILGPVGLLGGFIGKGQLKISCNSCGYNWSPSQTDYAEWGRQQKQRAKDL
ncbi:tellurium resistance protein TerD, partial [Salmonella enterica subsp. enterica serovar Typhi]|nr:tellurium resistance protein TerD [Salmonella enterica subsp. enterica serovar Typhi]